MKEYFQHENAIVESNRVGSGTRIWAFTHVLPGAVIGDDCNLCDHVFVENDVFIGDRVTIKSGVQIWDGITLEDDVFIGPNATFTNDPFPRSKQYLQKPARTLVRKGASIGANATILPGLVIGQHVMVGAGAVVTQDIPAYAIVVGNPARITGYVQINKSPVNMIKREDEQGWDINLNVKGVHIYELPLIVDLRGSLSYAEIEKSLPFTPKRYFIVYNVPNKEVRGEHAHRHCHQFLVCLRGSCSVVVDDGQNREEILLNRPNIGLHVPPMVWATEYKYSSDGILLVLASDIYKADDYIRDYDKYLSELSK